MSPARKMVSREFKTSEGVFPEMRSLGTMTVTVWPDVPQIEFKTERGKSCVLKGEDAGKLIQFISKPDHTWP